jgi:hypothetical protein
MGSLCHGSAREPPGLSLLGCTSRPAELGIPRTQAGRAGSGARGPQDQLAGACPLLPPSAERPTPPLYAVTSATAPGPGGRARCRSGGPHPAPARAETAPRHRSWSLTRLGPVPRAQARRLWAGREHLRALALTRVGGLVPLGPGHGGHPGRSRCAGSPESYRRGRPGACRRGRAAGRTAGLVLPRADRRGLRRRGDGGPVPHVPVSRAATRATNGALDRRSVSPPRARRQSSRAIRWGVTGPLLPRVDRRGRRACRADGLPAAGPPPAISRPGRSLRTSRPSRVRPPGRA